MIQTVPLKTLWLMGAKTRIVPDFIAGGVQDLCAPGGTLLDLCAGSGIVGRMLAGRYRVIANDVQQFSATIAGAHLEGDVGWAEALDALDPELELAEVQERNRALLAQWVGEALVREDELLAAIAATAGEAQVAALAAYRSHLAGSQIPGSQIPGSQIPGSQDPGSQSSASQLSGRSGPGSPSPAWLPDDFIEARRRVPRALPYALATIYFQSVYFGLRQAIELDSIRAAIDALPADAPYPAERRRIYLAALLYAASVSTSGTSHFAQPRSVAKDSELLAVARRRSINIVDEFHRAFDAIRREWGARPHQLSSGILAHRVTCYPAEALLAPGGPLASEDIDVIYLDPPYTADNYSRFYHVLETLVRYDYPELETRHGVPTRGLYPVRSARFQSDFCRRQRVEDAFRTVAAAAAERGSSLLVSYADESGLLLGNWRRQGEAQPRARFARLFREYFPRVEVRERELLHSGQGDSNRIIQELLVLCERA